MTPVSPALGNVHAVLDFLRFFVFDSGARTGRTDRRTGKTRNAAYQDGCVLVVSRHTGGRVHVVPWGWQHRHDTGRVQDWWADVDRSHTATRHSVASSSRRFAAL